MLSFPSFPKVRKTKGVRIRAREGPELLILIPSVVTPFVYAAALSLFLKLLQSYRDNSSIPSQRSIEIRCACILLG